MINSLIRRTVFRLSTSIDETSKAEAKLDSTFYRFLFLNRFLRVTPATVSHPGFEGLRGNATKERLENVEQSVIIDAVNP